MTRIEKIISAALTPIDVPQQPPEVIKMRCNLCGRIFEQSKSQLIKGFLYLSCLVCPVIK